jgi:dihydrofolate synthase/folylpolyglutamate synthase
MKHDIQQQLNYLNSLGRFGINPGLDTISKLLEALDNPHQKFKSIHVAGTNGKGSTSNFIAHALQESGLKTGLYTSPYVYSFNERIKINDSNISDKNLSKLIEKVHTTTETNNLQLTFFEFTTALTFLYFAEQKVDIAVIEVGMGGLLDATNVLKPLIAVITNIGLDHTKYLGTTKQAIAKRKAGIIKEGIPVVTAEKDPDIQKILLSTSNRKHVKLYSLDKHVTITSQAQSLSGQTFKTSQPHNSTFSIPLLGQHQIINACTALLTLHLLKKQGFNVSLLNIQRGFKQATWPGRLDIISKKPLIIADGAHNNDGVIALHNFLINSNLPKPRVLVFGAKQDKDISALIKKIVPLFDHVIITQGNYEPMPTNQIIKQIKQKNLNIHEVPNIKEALALGQKFLKPNHLMLITGSLYLVSDALAILRPQKML